MNLYPDFADPEAMAAFVEKFCARALPKPGWTHQAHLAVGLWHVLHEPEDALTLLRTRISAHNEAVGTANTDTGGYHETITRFYVLVLGRFIEARRSMAVSWPELTRDLLNSRLAHKDLPLEFYSRELLYSVHARRHWVDPDVRPIEAFSEFLPEKHY